MPRLLPLDATVARFEADETFIPTTRPEADLFRTESERGALTDEEPTTVPEWTRATFETRGICVATPGYNLVRLHLDTTHRDARNRDERGDESLRAVFEPMGASCPRAETPVRPASIDQVRVRVTDSHRSVTERNERLRELTSAYSPNSFGKTVGCVVTTVSYMAERRLPPAELRTRVSSEPGDLSSEGSPVDREAALHALAVQAGEVATVERKQALRAFDDGAVSPTVRRVLSTLAVRVTVGTVTPAATAIAEGDSQTAATVSALFSPEA